jgi:hypothetical protein
MQKVFICGLPGCGKGLLRTMIDGHSRVVTSPFQGFGMGIISDSFENKLLSNEQYANHIKNVKMSETVLTIENRSCTIGQIIDFISPTLNVIINSAVSNYIVAASSQENQVFVDFKFELSKLFDIFINGLIEINSTTNNNSEDILDLFIKCFIDSWSNKHNITTPEYFVQSSNNGLNAINCILNRTKRSKVIIVNRDPLSMIYTNTKRFLLKTNTLEEFIEVSRDKRLLSSFNKYSRTLYSKSYIKKINGLRNYIDEVKDNDRVLVINFEELVHTPNSVMSEVSHFLSINHEDVLNRASLNSIDVESSKIKFTGKVNDDSEGKLSVWQNYILKKLLAFY